MLRISADCFSRQLEALAQTASAVGCACDLAMIFTLSMLSTGDLQASRMCSRSCARSARTQVRRTSEGMAMLEKCSRISFSSFPSAPRRPGASMIAPKVVSSATACRAGSARRRRARSSRCTKGIRGLMVWYVPSVRRSVCPRELGRLSSDEIPYSRLMGISSRRSASLPPTLDDRRGPVQPTTRPRPSVVAST